MKKHKTIITTLLFSKNMHVPLSEYFTLVSRLKGYDTILQSNAFNHKDPKKKT